MFFSQSEPQIRVDYRFDSANEVVAKKMHDAIFNSIKGLRPHQYPVSAWMPSTSIGKDASMVYGFLELEAKSARRFVKKLKAIGIEEVDEENRLVAKEKPKRIA